MKRGLLGALVAVLFAVAPAHASTVMRSGEYFSGFGGVAAPASTPSGTALEGITAVDAGNASTYALKSDGTLWAQGDGERGQLGDGTTAAYAEAYVRVQFPEGTPPIIAIGEAKDAGYAIDSSGQAWSWGENGEGAGCQKSGRQLLPTKVAGLTTARAVQGGENHSLWLTSTGRVLVCGSARYGRLGLGAITANVHTPTEVPGLPPIEQVSAGDHTSFALSVTGRLYGWGENKNGQIGIGAGVETVWAPAAIGIPEPVISVSGGGDVGSNGSTLALTQAHTLYGWGYDNCGQVGDGLANTVDYLPVDTGLHFRQAVTGGLFSLGLDAEGNVFAWGSDAGGTLGDGASSGRSLTPILVLSGAMQVSATAKSALALKP